MTVAESKSHATLRAEALEALALERFTCRAFRPDRVPDSTIEAILATAQRSPSWCNTQPWQLLITRGEGTQRFREALYQRASEGGEEADFPFPRAYQGVYQERRRECGFQLYASLGIGRGAREEARRQMLENFRLFGAPHVAILTTDEALGVYGAIDCGAYLMMFLLAAQSQGIATAPQAALASQSGFIRDYFKLGPDRRMVCGVSFGFADADHPANGFRTGRAAISQSTTWIDE